MAKEGKYQRLTPCEIESLRQEMRQAGHWAKAELAKKRNAARGQRR